MGRSKLPPLAELKKRLSDQAAARGPAPVPAKPEVDDQSLFAAAVKGARTLPPSDRAELRKPPPAPVPRPRTSADEPEEETADRRRDDWLPAHWFDNTPQTAATPEETLLAKALHDVVPLQTDKVFIEPPKPRPVPIQHQLDEQAALAESIYAPTPLELVLEGGDELYYLREGTPRTTLRDLRRGRWVVQAQLDLHGANREEARDLLAAAFADWRKRDIRCVRIIHGKGLGSPGKEPILKKLVAGWLMNYDDVLGYCQARVHDGGAGALLVLMRAARR